MVKGNSSGISQHAFKSSGMNKRMVWNFPFELTYSSTNVCGWPKVVLYCSGTDFLGREELKAYGVQHVPCQPGKHTRYLKCFKPVCSSALQKVLGFFSGLSAEYQDAPKTLDTNEGREMTRVTSGGLIKITYQITQREFNHFVTN